MYVNNKRDKEIARAARKEAKRDRVQHRREAKQRGDDYREQFPSSWPAAPEPVAGVARTLSRGL